MGAVRDESRYADLFAHTTPEHHAIGEASTSYLRSRVAVPAIQRALPEAKFLACLRNPIEMVASAHMQLVKCGREPERSLAAAWEKQGIRLSGVDLPKFEDPEAFQYGPLCSLGEQMERLFQTVPQDQVHWILLDEMKEDPGTVYRNVLQFLNVQYDGRTCFPVENMRREPRFASVVRVTNRLAALKHWFGLRTPTGLGDMVQRWNNRPPTTNQLSPVLVATLREYFTNDIEKLGRLLGRDLSEWLN